MDNGLDIRESIKEEKFIFPIDYFTINTDYHEYIPEVKHLNLYIIDGKMSIGYKEGEIFKKIKPSDFQYNIQGFRHRLGMVIFDNWIYIPETFREKFSSQVNVFENNLVWNLNKDSLCFHDLKLSYEANLNPIFYSLAFQLLGEYFFGDDK